MNCDTPINHKDGIATIRTMSWWPMRPAFHLYKHPYKHHRRLTRRMFRGHPSLCEGSRSVTRPAHSDAKPAQRDDRSEHRAPTGRMAWNHFRISPRETSPAIDGAGGALAAQPARTPPYGRITAPIREDPLPIFREAAAPVVVKSEPLDCSEATAVTLCEPGASAFGRRTVQAPAFPTIAT